MAAAHRRGGKHAVKDEDLTHTKYDYYTREELLAAVKEAGCFVKDDKKSVMAKKLAKYDQDLMQIARRTAQEQKEKEEKDNRKSKRHSRPANNAEEQERNVTMTKVGDGNVERMSAPTRKTQMTLMSKTGIMRKGLR